MEKLDDEIERKSIICLQEVSTLWAGKLHAYFAAKGYHFITALYGNKFNGYMGVATAVPLAVYDVVDVDITRVADTKRMQKKKELGFFEKIWNYIRYIGYSIVFAVLRACALLQKEKPPLWDAVTGRQNQVITLRLRSVHTNKEFVVGNYHMPCMFEYPQVMVAHCALVAQHVAKYSGNDAFILAGDFNIKPSSSMYELLTTGSLPIDVSVYLNVSTRYGVN
jgi:exonuclease III